MHAQRFISVHLGKTQRHVERFVCLLRGKLTRAHVQRIIEENRLSCAPQSVHIGASGMRQHMPHQGSISKITAAFVCSSKERANQKVWYD